VSAAAAGLALGGGLLAWALHARGWLAGEPSGAGRLLLEGLGFDRAYGALVLRPARALGGWLSGAFERGVVDRTVWGAARAARGSGMGLSALQGGYVRGYASAALAGTVGLLLYVLWRLL
jgi:NADH:ubiquinone oxidoreductase subunit 5 (subunit L)/multisubunit Na+/H+ antiporter MnhA subunit